jgi:hypothetical protein
MSVILVFLVYDKRRFTYKCGACVEELRSAWNENTSRPKSTSQIRKKMEFPGRNLVLHKLKDNESLRVLLETVILNGACSNNMI